MSAQFERARPEEKIAAYVESRRIVLLAVLIVAVVAIAAYSILTAVLTKTAEKNLARIDMITYQLTQDSASLSDEELDGRRDDAMTRLAEFTGKGGIAGVRANMLAGEICYSQKKYEEAGRYWLSAAEKKRGAYTAPLAYFNAAVCAEESGDLDAAAEYYGKAVASRGFLQADHAEFSLGRVREAEGDFSAASESYRNVFDRTPDSSWGKLAKTRLIALEAEGKIE